jgi:hypothetical protein
MQRLGLQLELQTCQLVLFQQALALLQKLQLL